MREIQSEITIQQPVEKVWDILSDLTAMGNYMPGIEKVYFTSDEKQGVGAARHCIFDDGTELYERVLNWDEGQSYTLETTQFVKVPMKSNNITFALASQGSNTIVTQSMRYKMPGGIFSPIIEFMATSMMKKAIDSALTGLKQYAETQG